MCFSPLFSVFRLHSLLPYDLSSCVVLREDSLKVITWSGIFYQIDYAAICRLAKLKCIEQVVHQRFGVKSTRLFRLLVQESFVEQKQVKEMALVGAFKETKALLNTMLKENFVKLQEVPKQADRAPSKCFYLWAVDTREVTAMLLDQGYVHL